jgi:group I intron endonuclease
MLNSKGGRMLVYCITNNLSGKKYVGATERSLLRRYSINWCARLLSNKELKEDFLTNGQKSFSMEILKRPRTKKSLHKWESFFIKKMDCLYPKGYNFQYGKKVHEETKKRISETMIATRRHPNFGVYKNLKAFPCVVCSTLVSSYKIRGVYKRTCSDSCFRKNASANRSISVVCIDKNDKETVFKSLESTRKKGFDPALVSRAAKKNGSYKGHKWRINGTLTRSRL